MSKRLVLTLLTIGVAVCGRTQILKDSAALDNWSLHAQATGISQYHFPFTAKYSGAHSLLTDEPVKTSYTATLFIGRKLWKGAAVYFDPEMSGGSGFSKTLGVAGFPNGEVYRVGSSSPHVYVGRLYVEQYFALGSGTVNVADDQNQLQKRLPARYLAVRAGKFSIIDFFGNNTFSQDPRTQFLNWALMGCGGWDYPANTRGYTKGLSLEYGSPEITVRGAFVEVPKEANGPDMDTRVFKAFASVLEVERPWKLKHDASITLRVGGFYNQAHMGNYQEAIDVAKLTNTVPDVTATRADGRSKYGGYLSMEYATVHTGTFLRVSANDGKNETWAFTEIDRSVAAGFSMDGAGWKRGKDRLGVAVVVNGLSGVHRQYLENGGYGFLIGDGALNYRAECIGEVYYSFAIPALHVFVSPDYQLILNPGYNKDRGPAVHVAALRLHFEL